MKIKIKNRHGQIIDHDSALPVPDGCGIVSNFMIMDGADDVQRAIAGAGGDNRPRTATVITDSLGRTSGHRPGYCFDAGNDDAARSAYEAMKIRMGSAWKNTGHMIEWTEPARAIRGAYPARESMPGAWSPDELRAANPAPPDRSMSDAAWGDLVTRTENAWKTTGGVR